MTLSGPDPRAERRFLHGLARYADQEIIRFHTPGHRGGAWADAAILEQLSERAFALDMSDVLEGPDGPGDWSVFLREAEEKAAALYRTERTRFLVNGTSGGIHAVFLALGFAQKVAFGRASHLSVYAGAALSGADPAYIPYRYDREWDIPGPAAVDDVVAAVEHHGAKLLVDTYPNYYGLAHRIGDVVQRLGSVPVVVDEAHGSHFPFCPGSPPPALEAGCAASVQSAHKTLQSLTQSSLLHVAPGHAEAADRIDRALGILQTTSPSPLLLASLESSVAETFREGSVPWERAVQLADSMRREIERRTPFLSLNAEEALRRWDAKLDPARLVIRVGHAGWSGIQAAQALRKQFGIQVEMANQQCVVALISPGNSDEDGERLVAGLVELARAHEGPPVVSVAPPPPPPVRVGLRDAFGAPLRWTPLKESVGRVAGEIVCPYPPGIPAVVPGEEITAEIVEYLRGVQARGWEVRGARDETLGLIGVID